MGMVMLYLCRSFAQLKAICDEGSYDYFSCTYHHKDEMGMGIGIGVGPRQESGAHGIEYSTEASAAHDLIDASGVVSGTHLDFLCRRLDRERSLFCIFTSAPHTA